MKRLPILAAAVFLAAGTVLGAAGSASAATHMCETFDPTFYCVGTANLNQYTAAKEVLTGGRAVAINTDGGTYEGFQTATLQLTGGTNTCLVADPLSNGSIVVDPCSGVSGVTWALDVINGHYHFINKYWTEHNHGTNLFFAGDGNGDAYFVAPNNVGDYEAFEVA